jgi:uncharacterized protein YneF (UPF0154 family)
MKNYLMTDVAAGLCLLATICIGGFTYMEYQTKRIEKELKQYPPEVVKKGLHTQAEKTLFSRVVKHTE